MRRLKRVFHPYTLWEDAAAGMWRNVSGEERQQYLEQAARLMRDPVSFLAAMTIVTHTWPYSCEANLTTRSINRQAWIGHAATVLAVGAPEDVTRQAWWTLNQVEQDAANAVADAAIAQWESNYLEAKGA
jgi:hypothetical protein